ncbi:uncharacterized protein LOC117112092 [Anneissia japonica]|uniref:uncharacterized protein LOC117112092 n=1 Tax=Anneissia japonica TaxID=1529436 RepID=UPI001425A288|nr:uncharacterized protein LOC117112092 [Anneissia japonica]
MLLLFLLALISTNVAADKVCYGDLGCFTDDPPYDTFKDFPPRSPDYINTNFLLYTRLNDNIPMTIDRTDPSSLKISTFNSLKRTVFLIHGYTEAGLFSDWVQNVKTKLLEIENVNVVVVDWGLGAHDIYYKSVQNIRVVGAEIGLFIQFLNKEAGFPNRKIHIIGHSLGAHTAGYAGAMNPGIARITGLDPAGPEFRYNDPECRLDPTDAVLVDNIHTDGETLVSLGFGLLQPLGHMDFYPNGGKEQPGCPATVFDALAAIDEVSCSHSRSHQYFLESMDQAARCTFKAYPCASWDRFVEGKCSDCGLFGCPTMGYYADLSLASGNFYLETQSSEPFCKNCGLIDFCNLYILQIILSKNETRLTVLEVDMFSAKMLLFFLVAALSTKVLANRVCYGDLGCFTNDPSCGATFDDLLPKSPDYINTNFYLFTRLDTKAHTIDRTDSSTLTSSTFNRKKRTVFLIHGYTESGLNSQYVMDIKNKLLEMENVNVIVVDWGGGSRDIYYQSVQNIRVAGAEVGLFIQFLNKEASYSNSKIHIIGHSLGAHTAGYAGAMNSGIARITGLDPAGPEFRGDNIAAHCRLDPTDAVLVDNIHTDGSTLGFGLFEAVGDMDFYPNGGTDQPGCPATKFDATNIDEVSCSHGRSHQYFLESMEQGASCTFKSYPCNSYDTYVSGKCSSCGWQGCPTMGYYADQTSVSDQSFYLDTRSSSPYCKN